VGRGCVSADWTDGTRRPLAGIAAHRQGRAGTAATARTKSGRCEWFAERDARDDAAGETFRECADIDVCRHAITGESDTCERISVAWLGVPKYFGSAANGGIDNNVTELYDAVDHDHIELDDHTPYDDHDSRDDCEHGNDAVGSRTRYPRVPGA
jgi:hypothetical protein